MTSHTLIAVQIPAPLRPECGGAAEIRLPAVTVRAALEELERSYPTLYCRVCDETGAIRRHINLFVNDSFLQQREGLDTRLVPGDVLTIMPAVSGG